jgi:hypothetical protein
MREVLWLVVVGGVVVVVGRQAYRWLFADRPPVWRLALGLLGLWWLAGPVLAGNYAAMLIAVVPAAGVATGLWWLAGVLDGYRRAALERARTLRRSWRERRGAPPGGAAAQPGAATAAGPGVGSDCSRRPAPSGTGPAVPGPPPE